MELGTNAAVEKLLICSSAIACFSKIHLMIWDTVSQTIKPYVGHKVLVQHVLLFFWFHLNN